ncbi:MAG: response regulator [Bacteroidota bacterium]
MRGHILVVEDEEYVYEDLKYGLGKAHYFHYAASLAKVRKILKDYPIDLAFVDLNFQAGQKKRLSGLGYIKKLRQQNPALTIIVLSQYSDTDRIVKAVQHGADDYLIKTDIDSDSNEFREQVRQWVNKKKRKDKDRNILREDVWGIASFPENIWNQSLQLLEQKKSFILFGEPGLGKTELLKQLYFASAFFNKRRQVADIDLSQYTPQQLNDFLEAKRGHTQANFLRNQPLPILYLHNLDKVSLSIQEKFLALIVNQHFLNSQESFSVQLVFVLDRRPEDLIVEKRLSPELYFGVENILLLPLRERQDELLAIIKEWQVRHDFDKLHLHSDYLQKLKEYPFPGNIPELHQILAQTIDNHKSSFPTDWQNQTIQADSLPDNVLRTASDLHYDMHYEVAKVQLRFIEKALKKFEGKREQKNLAAQLLKVHSADNLKKTFINKYWEEYPALVKSFPTIMKKYKLDADA